MINLSTGPTELPSEVYVSLQREMISHRSREFKCLYKDIKSNLMKLAFSTTDPIIITTSGTGAIDSVISSLFNKKDKVLVISCGFYGDLIGHIFHSYDLDYRYLRIKDGYGIEVQDIKACFMNYGDFDYVFFTHNESSTGVMNNINMLASFIKNNSSANIIVDCISSFGSCTIQFDNIPIDIMITATQKGLMSTPGIAMIFIKEHLKIKILSINNRRGYYLNLKNYIDKNNLSSIVPFTPAVMSYFSLNSSLDIILDRGIDNIEKHQIEMSELCQNIVKKFNFVILAEKRFRSLSVTAFYNNEYGNLNHIFTALIDNNIVISQGNGDLKNSLLRVGHMGNVNKKNLMSFDNALKNII